MVLSEQLAVQDMVALGQFLLLPEDDLTLATVLKGPLFGFDEDSSVRSRLRSRRSEICGAGCVSPRQSSTAASPGAVERLSALLARADFVPPYELFAEILGARAGGSAMLRGSAPRPTTRSTNS